MQIEIQVQSIDAILYAEFELDLTTGSWCIRLGVGVGDGELMVGCYHGQVAHCGIIV